MTPVHIPPLYDAGDEPQIEQTDFLAALHQITLDLLNHRRLDDLLQAIVESASQMLHVPNVEIMLREEDELVVRAAVGIVPNQLGERVRRDQARVTWSACDDLQPVIMEDYGTWAHRRTPYEGFDIHAVASIPIVVGGGCFGVLDLSRVAVDRPFTPTEIQKAQLFTQMVALLLENTRLYETAVKEIERRKKAVEALGESEERLRVITDSMHEMVAYLNLKGEILYVNPSYARNLGYDPLEMIGKLAYPYIYPEDLPRLMLLFQDAMERGVENSLVQARCIHADGHLVWVEASGTFVYDSSGQLQGVLTVFRDINEQVELERLQQEEAQLQVVLQKEVELSELKSRMMIRLGHEFRTPLSIIQTSTDMLERYLDRLTPEARKSRLHAIQTQIQNVTDMLDAMNGVVRGSLIPDKLLLARVDFSALCEDIIAEIDNSVSVSFEEHISPGIVGSGDYAALRNAFRSLLCNAAQYSLPDGEITVDLSCNQDILTLVIQDQGIGIPEEEILNIFEPFFRGSNVGETRGLGLGLTVARAAIEAHQGVLTVESVPDGGTQVVVTLPIRHDCLATA